MCVCNGPSALLPPLLRIAALQILPLSSIHMPVGLYLLGIGFVLGCFGWRREQLGSATAAHCCSSQVMLAFTLVWMAIND